MMLIHSYKAFISSRTIQNFWFVDGFLPRLVTSFEGQSNFDILLAKRLPFWYFCTF